MTLIKLDSGDYINTEFIAWMGIDHRHANRITVSTTEISANLYQITSADRDRIVEAMSKSDNVKPNFTRLVMAYTKLDAINEEQIRNHTSLDFSPALEFLRKAINGEE